MEELVSLFKSRLIELGGEVVEVPHNPADSLREFLLKNDIETVASWDTSFLRELLDSISPIGVLYPEESADDYRRHLLKVQAGITGSLFAVADSGTLVLPVSETMPSLVSLIPEIHIAFVEKSKILKNFEELFQKLWEQGPVEYILVSGPSRTADIEQTLTVGVHGPKRVVAFLLSE